MLIFAWIIWSLALLLLIDATVTIVNRVIKAVKYGVGFHIQFQWLPWLISLLSFIFLCIYLFG